MNPFVHFHLSRSLCRGSRAGGIQSINPEPTAARFRTLKAQPAPLGSRAPSTRGAHKPDHGGGGICGRADERQQLQPIDAEDLRATASGGGGGGGKGPMGELRSRPERLSHLVVVPETDHFRFLGG